MKKALKLATTLMFAVCLADADGGMVCLREGSGAFLVTVFVAPQPVRAGPIDTSVLVQDRQTGVMILDAKVDVAVRRAGGRDPEVLTHATHEQSTNRVLQSGNHRQRVCAP